MNRLANLLILLLLLFFFFCLACCVLLVLFASFVCFPPVTKQKVERSIGVGGWKAAGGGVEQRVEKEGKGHTALIDLID